MTVECSATAALTISSRLAVALCCVLALSACTRTSDGSIEAIQPIALQNYSLGGFGNWWGRAEAANVQAAQFPAAPETPAATAPATGRTAQPRRFRPRAPRLSLAAKPLFQPATQSQPLDCRNVTGSTGRVRVVCG